MGNSPEQQPAIEDIFNPNSDEYIQNPAPHCQALAKQGRLVYYPPWMAWIMTQIDDIQDCWHKEPLTSDFYDWEFAPPRPPEAEWTNFEKALIGHSLLADHQHHRLVRKVVSPAFSRNVVEEIQRRIRPDIEKLFDNLGQPETFDYVEEVSQHIPFISITRMIGVPEKYWDEFKPAVMNFTKTWNPTISDEEREESRQQCNRAIDIIKEVIAERRGTPQQDDFLSTMLDIEKENDDFEEWDIITLVLALIGAGSDTTLVFQQWTSYALVKHKEQREIALTNIDTFSNAINEISRWGQSSKMGFARYAPDDMELLGQKLTKGQMVLLMPHLRNNDPAVFPEPRKFDVTRTFEPDILFGYGPRFCIGAALAKQQLYLTMLELFKRFPNIELANEPTRNGTDHNAITLNNLIFKTNC